MKIKKSSQDKYADDLDDDIDKLDDPKIDDFKDDFDDDFSKDIFNDSFGGMQATPAMEKHSDLLKNLTNFSPYIKEKIHGWLGMRFDENSKKWIPDPSLHPIMNKRGAMWCIDYLKTYTRENNIITNIGDREYKLIIGDVIEVLWLDVGCCAEMYGIQSNTDLHRICVELEHAVELVLMGAGDGKYNKLLTETTTRNENISHQQGQMDGGYGMRQVKKKGLFGGLKTIFGGS